MHLINVPTMQQVIEHVVIGEDEPAFVWGPPGCGKSEGTRAIAQKLDLELIEIRLGQYDSVDLRGLPDLDASDLTTVWRMPSTIPFVGNPRFDPDKKKLIFFDEANGGKPATLGVMYQIVQERRCGEHALMPNTHILLAGNRDGDKGITNKMPTPLLNKCTHYEMAPDAKAWVTWAAGQPRIPAELLALLSFRPDLVTDFDPMSGEKAFATPRTWEKAGHYYTSGMPEDIRDASIEGCVGKDAANWFRAFCKTTHDMISIDDIERDPLHAPISDKGEVRWMTSVGIGGAMAQNPERSQALHQYLKRMDPEFGILAWQLGLGKNEKLIGQPGFLDMSRQHQAIFASVNKN